MSFNFYGPWIDPRWKRVTVPHLMHYLCKHGWAESQTERQYLRRFELPIRPGPVWVPTPDDASDDEIPHLIFNAVTQIARVEERYAGAVLDDLLVPEAMVPAQPQGGARQPVQT